MDYIAIASSIIFTSDKDQTVTLQMWNDEKMEEGKEMEYIGPQLTITAGGIKYNDKDSVAHGVPNEFPDIVHNIPLKSGESISAFCSRENVMRFLIIQS